MNAYQHTKANLHKLVKMSVKANISGAYVMKTVNSAPCVQACCIRCGAALRSALWVLIIKIRYLTIISPSIRTCEYYTLFNFWRLADCVIRSVINKGVFPGRPILIFSCAWCESGAVGVFSLLNIQIQRYSQLCRKRTLAVRGGKHFSLNVLPFNQDILPPSPRPILAGTTPNLHDILH